MEEILDVWKPQKDDSLALRPCPFCGGEEIVYLKYMHDAGERWKIMCCGCTAGVDPGYARQRSIVQEIWNKRVN